MLSLILMIFCINIVFKNAGILFFIIWIDWSLKGFWLDWRKLIENSKSTKFIQTDNLKSSLHALPPKVDMVEVSGFFIIKILNDKGSSIVSNNSDMFRMVYHIVNALDCQNFRQTSKVCFRMEYKTTWNFRK